MLDLHCHILPGVDDGAPDLTSALEIARAMVALGFTHVAPSPHTGGGPGGDVPTALNARTRALLIQALASAGIALQVLPNAEHLVGPTLMSRLPDGATCIGGDTHWLLVELPWEQVPDPEGQIAALQTLGYRILLAHPERYGYLELPAVVRLASRGVCMQVELGTFADVYGDRARARAEKMAREGLVHVLASDIHRPKQAVEWLGKALMAVRDAFGEAAVQRATRDNPQAILTDAITTAVEPMSPS